jgi:RNA polymerase sigma factor (sigma-70 family)
MPLGSAAVSEPSDAELLVAARSGQATAWNALVKRHTGRLWAIARSNGLDRDEAFDVVQATWLELFNSADRIRDPQAIAGWLNRVASHEAIRRSKRARRMQPVEEVRMRETNEDEFTGILRREDIALIRRHFAQLDESCRQLLSLLFADQPLQYREVSELLERPIGWVGPTRDRCLEKLRRLVTNG